MKLLYIDKDLQAGDGVPMLMMARVFKAASKAGLKSMEDLMDRGAPVIFDEGIGISVPSDIAGCKVLFLERTNDERLVKTDKGDLIISTNNAGTPAVGKAVDKPLGNLPDGLKDWLATGDRGTSSEYIAHKLFGYPEGEDYMGYGYPHDGGDLGRCLELIKAVPEIRGRMDELEGDEWKALAEHWDELEKMHASPGGVSIYERINEILENIDQRGRL